MVSSSTRNELKGLGTLEMERNWLWGPSLG